MELLKVEIPMSKLFSIPEDEQVFFVQIGNFLNDLSYVSEVNGFFYQH